MHSIPNLEGSEESGFHEKHASKLLSSQNLVMYVSSLLLTNYISIDLSSLFLRCVAGRAGIKI